MGVGVGAGLGVGAGRSGAPSAGGLTLPHPYLVTLTRYLAQAHLTELCFLALTHYLAQAHLTELCLDFVHARANDVLP